MTTLTPCFYKNRVCFAVQHLLTRASFQLNDREQVWVAAHKRSSGPGPPNLRAHNQHMTQCTLILFC